MRDDMTATFRHGMPFGAEIQPDGRTAFRVWAPAQQDVSLVLKAGGPERVLPMTRAADGMFHVTAEAGAGARYSFLLRDERRVPDPASRFQPEDVHAASEVIDPAAYHWIHTDWHGRPWEEAVIYEAHVGCFSLEGTFDGMRRKLDHLTDVGITVLEIMPLSDFEGRRNWGYDGVLPFAPDSAYGCPDDLKRLIDEAHGRGLMVLLDVVYNHFGPTGNYLSFTAPQFFTDKYKTPWGGAVNFEDTHGSVRAFFVHNALYWLNEYRFDGLRFDAVHAIFDQSRPDILEDIAAAVRREIAPGRHVHLILENDNNRSSYLDRRLPAHYEAQWNDDYHHAAHVLATGETQAHFADYAASPVHALAACLARGFFHNGVPSAFRGGEVRGEDTSFLPPTAFIDFLQNHDQIGNRNDGKRLAALIDDAPLRALTAMTVLSPAIPMFFMGEEWASERPFYYFCDFKDDLAAAVREGRCKEFERQNEEMGVFTPPTDHIAVDTFARSKLDWDERRRARQRAHMIFVCRLLMIRHAAIVPALKGMPPGPAAFKVAEDRALLVRWRLAGRRTLTLAANLSNRTIEGLNWDVQGKELIALNATTTGNRLCTISPWDVHVYLEQEK
jgi:malto-oligosyltrehalose trehalohydrolase